MIVISFHKPYIKGNINCIYTWLYLYLMHHCLLFSDPLHNTVCGRPGIYLAFFLNCLCLSSKLIWGIQLPPTSLFSFFLSYAHKRTFFSFSVSLCAQTTGLLLHLQCYCILPVKQLLPISFTWDIEEQHAEDFYPLAVQQYTGQFSIALFQ